MFCVWFLCLFFVLFVLFVLLFLFSFLFLRMPAKNSESFEKLLLSFVYVFFQMAQKVTIHLWGDSHLTKRHLVPRLLKERLEAGQFSRYRTEPVGHAMSGQKMTQAYAKEMRDYVEKNKKRPMCHVLQIGSNDIWDKPSEAKVEEVLGFVRDVANRVLKSSTSALVLTAPIPGDKPEAVEFFEKLDNAMRKEVEAVGKNRRFTYVDFVSRSFKKTQDGSRFDPAYWEDHRHLNRKGVARFVAALADVIRTLPMAVFGLQKTKKNRTKRTERRREAAAARDGYSKHGGKQGSTPGGSSSKPKPGDSGSRVPPRGPPARWDLRHQLGPKDLRGQLSRPARAAPSATVTSGAFDLMDRPLPPPAYRYDADGWPQPLVPAPMAPMAAMWQPLPPMWHVPPPPPPMPTPTATTTSDRSWMLPPPLQPTVVTDDMFEEERRRTERLRKLKEKREAEYLRMKAANDALERELLGERGDDAAKN